MNADVPDNLPNPAGTGGPVVVGVDGSESSARAAWWAGREAALHRAPLRIVHAAERGRTSLPSSRPRRWDAGQEAAARLMLDQAAGHAREAGPGVPVATAVLDGSASDELSAASREARLIVVGTRGRGETASALLGSVGRHLISRASCPVAIVRSESGGHDRITVGVGGPPGRVAVLDFAFREAALRGSELLAVHAWTKPAAQWPGDVHQYADDTQGIGMGEARLLDRHLSGWRERYPGVKLVVRIVYGDPAAALTDASAGSDLVVLGAQTGPLGPGAIVDAVTHDSRAPVVVVRQPRV
jgi:nucleotide-binding universal stress UspA family protein